jgi:hypothetical protein
MTVTVNDDLARASSGQGGGGGGGGGEGGGPTYDRVTFSLDDASTFIGKARFYPDRTIKVTSVFFSLGEAASNSETVIDVKKNGVSIFSGENPTASAGQYRSTEISGLNTTVTPSDYLTVDVITGSDAEFMTVLIVFSQE